MLYVGTYMSVPWVASVGTFLPKKKSVGTFISYRKVTLLVRIAPPAIPRVYFSLTLMATWLVHIIQIPPLLYSHHSNTAAAA